MKIAITKSLIKTYYDEKVWTYFRSCILCKEQFGEDGKDGRLMKEHLLLVIFLKYFFIDMGGWVRPFSLLLVVLEQEQLNDQE